MWAITMACKIQGNAILCTMGSEKYCQYEYCGRLVIVLCDFQIKDGTCDMRLCEKHRKRVGKNKDYCPKHNLEVIEGARNTK